MGWYWGSLSVKTALILRVNEEGKLLYLDREEGADIRRIPRHSFYLVFMSNSTN